MFASRYFLPALLLLLTVAVGADLRYGLRSRDSLSVLMKRRRGLMALSGSGPKGRHLNSEDEVRIDTTA